ncbi:MAG TPA: glycosyltransferase family 2 protein [Bacteroidales bacterium]|jgi:dolichol-phosphate mannosyltransferase|nr:glycosyltransferase family 2 protein [Bacteroidales bacterium]HOR82690.1 glycosyltransferase family 2 protein [Bacteroidales bacterium]HPJ91864.1 glycosyltransferase family 2 protein [Bacteroidales bacterium]HPX59042.1 glycosyltransferase family 2 protein [Bacteroidales bacterium]HQB19686.1 glycosyltransferase family 2 protein [Bacteroidales bacterium]
MLLSVIIPCYNEELVIEETYKRLTSVLGSMQHSYELIFINDGSRDKTYDILFQLSEKDAKVKILHFSRNFGHQCAVTAGINHCNGDAAVIIDSDLQDPPEVIIDMLKIMEEEKANVVYGVRKKRKGETWFKLVTAKYFYRILNSLSDVKFPVDTGDFRLIDRNIIDTFNRMEEKNKYIRGLISWMGYKQVPCYYEREERFAGETKYPLKKMLKFAMIGVFYFSKKPLKLATYTGFISVAIGILYALIALITKLINPSALVTGWTTIIVLIVFFGGVQLITIGVLGQYIGNLFDEAKKRPEYIVGKKINF